MQRPQTAFSNPQMAAEESRLRAKSIEQRRHSSCAEPSTHACCAAQPVEDSRFPAATNLDDQPARLGPAKLSHPTSAGSSHKRSCARPRNAHAWSARHTHDEATASAQAVRTVPRAAKATAVPPGDEANAPSRAGALLEPLPAGAPPRARARSCNTAQHTCQGDTQQWWWPLSGASLTPGPGEYSPVFTLAKGHGKPSVKPGIKGGTMPKCSRLQELRQASSTCRCAAQLAQLELHQRNRNC
jgi:hypothetical protein